MLGGMCHRSQHRLTRGILPRLFRVCWTSQGHRCSGSLASGGILVDTVLLPDDAVELAWNKAVGVGATVTWPTSECLNAASCFANCWAYQRAILQGRQPGNCSTGIFKARGTRHLTKVDCHSANLIKFAISLTDPISCIAF